MKKPVLRALAAAVVLAILLGLGFGAQSTFAKVWDSWDWVLVGGQNKRTLKYCIDPNLDANLQNGNINWGQEVDDAATNWNNAATGWSLQKVAWTDPECQIKITSGETGGDIAQTRCPPNAARRVTQCTITIDPTPGGYGRTYGSTINTYNPEYVIKHEFGHTMRLDDHVDGHVMRGRADPADDNPTLSADDIQEAKDADTEPIASVSGIITPAGGAVLVVNDFFGDTLATITIPPNAVAVDTPVSASVDYRVSTPFADSVPIGVSPVFRSVYIHDQSLQPIALLLPAQIEINYADLFQGSPLPGEAIDQARVVPTGSGLPGISEVSLLVLTRSEGTVDPWATVIAPSIDIVAHKVSFSTDELRTYGIAGSTVGGTVEILGQAGSPADAPASGSSFPYAALAGAAAAAVALITAGSWYVRRRLS